MKIETTILKALIKHEPFSRRVLPFLKKEYFQGTDAKLFEYIQSYYGAYNEPPSLESLSVDVNKASNYSEDEMKEANGIITSFNTFGDVIPKEDWLLDTTEKFCQDRAIYLAMSKSIGIMDGRDKQHDRGAIPALLSEALSVCFDPNVGHDYFEDADKQWEYYHNPVSKIPFDLEMLNKITKGGVSKKTLNMIMAGTGVGKSIFLCHLAAAYLAQGLNVLYVTLEMSENELRKRIDANLFNLNIDDVLVLPKADYERRVSRVKERTKSGKLIIKEYPTTGASVLHIKALLNELDLKKHFKPDVVIIDYINIMASSRLRSGAVNMYQYVKAITEEVRGLAVEFKIPVWSATQVNRTGFGDSDPEMDATSESFGLPMTVDLLLCLIGSEALAALQQIMVKQLKNRYRDENKDRRFVLGLDKDKMRFSDVIDNHDQQQARQIIQRTEAGERGYEEVPWEEFQERQKNITREKSEKFTF
jgi:archaellum biogenesis ATPase FlaH